MERNYSLAAESILYHEGMLLKVALFNALNFKDAT